MFREPELDALQAQLNINNQSIAVAFQNYMAALAQVRAARSQYFPTISAVPTFTWGRSSGVTTRGTSTATTGFTGVSPTSGGTRVGRFDAYVAPLVASWAPDLFGRVRYTVRQREYGAQVSAADLESTRLLAQAILAQTYFQLRGQDALQELLDATVAANEQVVTLTRQRFDHGLETESTVVQAELTLEASRVQQTNAGILRAQYEHAIATLLAIPATDFRLAVRAELPAPPAIPIGTPSQLLERRPDIAAAERQMAIANAAIGFAYTAYFPTVTLSGEAGFATNAIKTLFSWPRRIWAVGVGISETLFDAGLRRANVDAAVASYNATVAFYRQTVLSAFQQVEDLLAQMRINERAIEQQRHAVALAEQAFDLERARYEAGLDPYINLMLQQTAVLAARQYYVGLKVEQMAWAVQLVQALGGGWDRSLLPGP
jgi:NodT family efflux transporter outer membrane factor (OMF) lipoprotein